MAAIFACKNNVYLCFLIVQRHSEWREEEELWPVHVTWPLVIIILVNYPLFALSQLLFVDFLHSDRQETFCLAPFRSSPLPKYAFTSRSQSSLEVSVVSNKSWCSIIIWKTKKKIYKPRDSYVTFTPICLLSLAASPPRDPTTNEQQTNVSLDPTWKDWVRERGESNRKGGGRRWAGGEKDDCLKWTIVRSEVRRRSSRWSTFATNCTYGGWSNILESRQVLQVLQNYTWF